MSIAKVLIIAEEPWITLDLKYRLQRLGYKTIVASKSLTLQDVIDAEQPDLVLLEKQKVESETVGTIEAADLPIICFNAESQPFEIPIDLPCLAYPYQENLLDAAIRANLRHHRIQTQLAQQLSDNQKQIELLHTVEHELRDPLSSLLITLDWIELMEQAEQSPQSLQKLDHLALARNSVQHIAELLDRTSLVCRCQAGKLSWEPVWIDLGEFCQDLIAEIEQLYSNANIDFVCLSAHPMIEFDEMTLRQILSNLLTNAVKYSQDSSPIYLSLTRNTNHVIFQVQDRGIGISEADRALIFTPLYRGSNVKEIPGTGMGLAIVHQLVSAARGSVTVESTPTVGSTFTVTLPLSL
ncbi:hypothetical protein H6F51_14500 [Cyanobacteria bacterium FACHB-DQ100]|nr:hypothetical protein [Cyanobacteria bacterium FACHB-DQ100]